MSWVSNFLHPGRGYKKGQEELEKYYNQSNGYQQPYNQNGLDAYSGIAEAMKRLLNPGGLRDEWAKGYKESEDAKQNEGIATEHGLNAADSLGLGGSSSALQAIQGGTSKIALDEKNNYLNDLMQKYLAGIGIGQNIYGTGASTAANQGNNALREGENQANLAYGRENAGGNFLSNALGWGAGVAAPGVGNWISNKWNLAGG